MGSENSKNSGNGEKEQKVPSTPVYKDTKKTEKDKYTTGATAGKDMKKTEKDKYTTGATAGKDTKKTEKEEYASSSAVKKAARKTEGSKPLTKAADGKSIGEVSKAGQHDFVVYRALFDFPGQNEDDLVFLKDDRLRVLTHSQTSEWWIAHNIRTGKDGLIPQNYVCADDNSHEEQKWFFKSEGVSAENLLLDTSCKPGTFLVRVSSDHKGFVLCVRGPSSSDSEPRVLRYRIRRTAEEHLYISVGREFNSLPELIDHYHMQQDGLACLLKEACPRARPVVHFRQLEVERKFLRFTRVLGQGQFGEVLAALWKERTEVAVKTVKPGAMTTEQFLNEARIMHRLRHQNLVQLLAICTKQEPVLIITELMPHGALLDCLRQDEGRTLGFSILMNFSSQIANGMGYLEKQGFVHRDLRAANVLVGDNYVAKVSDFGLAKVMRDQKYSPSQPFTFPVRWTAPEAALQHVFSGKSDVWSYGVLLYEIVTYGAQPYAELRRSADSKHLLSQLVQGYRMPNPDGQRRVSGGQSRQLRCPAWLYDIMLNCWSYEPAARPEFSMLQDLLADFFDKRNEN